MAIFGTQVPPRALQRGPPQGLPEGACANLGSGGEPTYEDRGPLLEPPDPPIGAVELPGIVYWNNDAVGVDQERALDALERGAVLRLPGLGFRLAPSERRFLARHGCSENGAAAIGFDFATGRIDGTRLSGDELGDLAAMIIRFSYSACALVESLFPRYRRYVAVGRTSFHPVEVGARIGSGDWDDPRLHIDAFRDRPSRGRRILRVGTNVNPDDQAWRWRVGEPFASFAARFLPGIRRLCAGEAWLLERLHVTRGRRTDYDRLMLVLQERARADADYQAAAASIALSFEPGTSWIAFTDQVPHATLAGQHALEQTFLVNPAGLHAPQRAPLAILEELTGRCLT